MNKTITIFGSAIPREDDAQYKFAYELGAALAKEGFNIFLILLISVILKLEKFKNT